MTDLIIREPLAARIREIAQRENREPEEVIATLINRYASKSPPPPIIPEYPPRPRESLTDDLIDVPEDIQDKEGYREAARRLAPKLYEKAREYWQETGNTERLALTDEDLDKQFWLFDPDGVPRLRSEMGTIEIPPDPLEALIGLIDTDQTDLSITVRESVAEHYRKKYGRPD